MNRTFFRYSLKMYFCDPLFYVCSLFEFLSTGFYFFFVGKFFSVSGTSDLRNFFVVLSLSFILTVPLLVFRLRFLIFNDSLPVPPFSKNLSVNFAVFVSALVPTAALFMIPAIVNIFGAVDFSGVIAGFSGIFLILLCEICWTVFIFTFFNKKNPAFSIFLSVLFLSALNFIHVAAFFVPLPTFISKIFREASFFSAFDSFSKGIFDSRDISFFLISSFTALILTCFSEYKSKERRISRAVALLFLLTLVFSFVWTRRLYFRVDVSAGKKYSLSKTSKNLVEKIDSPLRITYFKSDELYDFYPESSEIPELLKEYTRLNKNVSFSTQEADAKKMSALGIQSQNVRKESGQKVEFVPVYSAVLIQYLEKSELVPLVLSSQTLEFDVATRIQKMLTGFERKVFVACANGLSLQTDYSYFMPWLSSRGFSPSEIPLKEISATLGSLPPEMLRSSLFVLIGSSKLSFEQAQSVKFACESGLKCLFMTSPYSAKIGTDWSVCRNEDDFLIPVLNGWGFAFEFALAQDISNFSVVLENQSGGEVTSEPYPLWIRILPQTGVPEGITLFWASPVVCYGEAKPLFYSSDYAWIQKGAPSEENQFTVNPLLIEKQPESRRDFSKLALGAAVRSEKLAAALIPDQYFVSSLMTGFISTETHGDFRNFDFCADILFRLNGETEIAALMNKSSSPENLYKIQNRKEFDKKSRNSLAVFFSLFPAALVIFGAGYNFFRKRKGRNEKKASC